MAVYQVEPRLDAVERVARDAGGYLSSRQDAVIVIRVPRDRFDEAIARIEKLGDVTHRDIKAQDVTDEFVDLQARLKNAYAIRDRLTDLLSRAAVKDALEIEKELGRVTEEIERMEGKLKLLRDQIAFSTITVTFARWPPQDGARLVAPRAFPVAAGARPAVAARRAPVREGRHDSPPLRLPSRSSSRSSSPPPLRASVRREDRRPASSSSTTRSPTYDYRAIAPEGVVVAVRVVDTTSTGDLEFWTRATTLRMHQLDGYALLGTADVKSRDGIAGPRAPLRPRRGRQAVRLHAARLRREEARSSSSRRAARRTRWTATSRSSTGCRRR